MKRMWIMRENASDLILHMMIWAIGTILVTRYWLQMMGWPTISFGEWHIAHVLFGGILMIVAMVMVMASYGRRILRIGSIIFGIGWGLFVDEIGKYLTKNNDYWFQPAIIFIYISFIILFLVYRHIDKIDDHTNLSLLYSIMSDTENIVDGQLTKIEKDKILAKIDKYSSQEKDKNKIVFAKEYKRIIDQITTVKKPKSTWTSIFRFIASFSYNKIFKAKIVQFLLIIYTAIYAIDKIIDTYKILMTSDKLLIIEKTFDSYNFLKISDIYMISFKIGFELIAAVLFGIGLYFALVLRRTKKALTWFQYGLLVTIFFTSVFRFYFEQFSGTLEVIISIGLYYALASLKLEKLGKK